MYIISLVILGVFMGKVMDVECMALQQILLAGVIIRHLVGL
jgi:hypothetical protein